MNVYEYFLIDPDELKGRVFIITDAIQGEGRLGSPMGWAWNHALLEFKIWYLGLYLSIRGTFQEAWHNRPKFHQY
jgi:hypothetical protein